MKDDGVIELKFNRSSGVYDISGEGKQDEYEQSINKKLDTLEDINEGFLKNKKTLLHAAACEGNLKIAEILVKRGADVNSRDEFEETPLHYAANEGHLEMAEFLITKGADVNAKNYTDNTPLHDAAKKNWPDMVKLLLDNGANINIINISGKTPLGMAATYKSDAAERVLKKAPPLRQQKF